MQDSREKATVPEQREGIHGDWQPKKQDYHILGSLALVSLVVALDSTILITSLPAMSRDLGGTATEAFWAATSYLLTYAVLQPVIASLSGVFGRRKSLFVSVLLFAIGSLIACLAKNFACLLAGRTIQGIRGGGVMVLVLVIATDVIPLRCLPKYQGIVQIAWAIGTMSGPLIGGVFAQLTTWRWVFYINFPICGIGLLLVLFTIPKGVLAGTAKGGAAMLVASFTTFLVAITLGGTTFPWGTVHIILPLVIGILGIAATFVWELLGARAPILPPSLFRRRFSTVPYICAFIQGFLFIPASIISGILVTKCGHLRLFIVIGWALTILATGLLSLCHGILVVGHVYAAQANVSSDDAANATAFCCFTRSIGFCAGVAIGGSIVQNILTVKLKNRWLSGSIATDAVSYAGMLRSLPADEPTTIVLMEVFSDSFQVLALALTGIAGLGGVLSLMVPRYVSGFRASRHGEV
ncbi:MFS general substrate transporter [Aspergillus pseudodeflectus]|uniref:MFS general substrate transporter n=1 Tax=Aspergillus pseudodeflectus TaxID=176178 RepID=A0ABR4L594_9EURO